MQVRLHANARTTPKIREYIQTSDKPALELAKELCIHVTTVYKWKKREDVEDKSHRPKEMHTTMSEEEEWITVELRKTLLLPLDDLLVVVQRLINPKVSRSALSRCLQRYGVSQLK